MAKIKLKTTLKTKDFSKSFDTFGIKNNNRYSFIEDDCKVIIDILDDCVKMIRKKDDYELEFLYSNISASNLSIKLGNNITDVEIVTDELVVSENQIIVVYKIEKDIFKYVIQFVGDNNDNE